jgi:hypothetical protein
MRRIGIILRRTLPTRNGEQIATSMITEFENLSVFKPGNHTVGAVPGLLDEVTARRAAFASLRYGAIAKVTIHCITWSVLLAAWVLR